MTSTLSKSSSTESGMTLLEMMVSVSILVLIIVGLTAAFNQTQRIFMTGLSQTDTLEGGRSALDLIRRDIEPAAGWQNISNTTPVAAIGIAEGPVPMSLPSGAITTNVLEKFFLLRQLLTGAFNPATNFIGVGYCILNTYTNLTAAGKSELNIPPPFVGALYRFSSANVLVSPPVGALAPVNLPNFVLSALPGPAYSPANLVAEGYLTPVLDGVVHFQINLYDKNGTLMTNYFPQNLPTPATPGNIMAYYGGNYYAAYASAPPAFVEIELGVMDPAVLEQFKTLYPTGDDSVPNPETMGLGLLPTFGGGGGGGGLPSVPQQMAGFISSHSANVHYFRTQVPIRTSLTTPLP